MINKVMNLAHSYFYYWTDGSTCLESYPDPPKYSFWCPAKPFVVRWEGDHYIPLNVLVFAKDEEHAKARVVAAIEECCEKDYTGPEGKDQGKWILTHRQHELLKLLREGKLSVYVEPFDIRIMPSIQWASNGGL